MKVQNSVKKKWYQQTGWIIFLLIVFFPVGLFLMWKYTNWNKWLKIGITLFFVWALFIPTNKKTIESNKRADIESIATPTPQPSIHSNPKKSTNEVNPIECFVDLYNKNTDKKIENIVPADLQGNDYRTEFRLPAFDEAVGSKGKIGNTEILIVNYGIFNLDSLRVYINPGVDCDINEIVKNTIHTLDSNITEQEINDLLSSTTLFCRETGHIDGYIEKNKAMVDCTKLNFN